MYRHVRIEQAIQSTRKQTHKKALPAVNGQNTVSIKLTMKQTRPFLKNESVEKLLVYFRCINFQLRISTKSLIIGKTL